MVRSRKSEVRSHRSEISNPNTTYEQSSIQSAAAAARRSALEVGNNALHHPSVSKVEQMEAELRKLSQTELCQIREWLNDMIEDQLPFAPEFERSIQQAERDMADGKSTGGAWAFFLVIGHSSFVTGPV